MSFCLGKVCCSLLIWKALSSFIIIINYFNHCGLLLKFSAFSSDPANVNVQTNVFISCIQSCFVPCNLLFWSTVWVLGANEIALFRIHPTHLVIRHFPSYPFHYSRAILVFLKKLHNYEFSFLLPDSAVLLHDLWVLFNTCLWKYMQTVVCLSIFLQEFPLKRLITLF